MNVLKKYKLFPLFSVLSATFLLFSIQFNLLSAQEIIISGEESVLQNNPAKTKMHYEEEAYRAAVQMALEKAFGTSVISNYERLTRTEMMGRSVEYHDDIRNHYLNTFPNGIWIKDKSKDCFEEKDKNGRWWTTCKVTGIARKIETAEVRFVAHTLDGTDPVKNRSETFNSGRSGYLYFRGAEPGSLIVFYDDMKNVQRCIPYNSSSGFDIKVDANREYIFFSRQHANYIENKNEVDEIEFYTDLPMDYNQFIIVFSPKPFRGYFLNPAEPLEGGYTTFQSMSKEYFHSWLQEQRLKNSELQVRTIGVTIRN